MRTKTLLTPGEFHQTVKDRAFCKYLGRIEEFFATNPTLQQLGDFLRRAKELEVEDWFKAEREVQAEYTVVPMIESFVQVAAYFVWLNRQRLGIPGTQDQDWLVAQEAIAQRNKQWASRQAA